MGACDAAGLFETVQLTAPIEQHWLYIGDTPHLYPLARVDSRYPRYAAVVADTNTARIMVFATGDSSTPALQRVKARFGNEAIFAGSYGWASAGRFHHAQSQLHRFLNGIGGYTASIDTYSYAAVSALMPHIVGDFSGPLLAMVLIAASVAVL